MSGWTSGVERFARFVQARPYVAVLITGLVLFVLADDIRRVLPTDQHVPDFVIWILLPVMAYGLVVPILFRRRAGSTVWLLMMWGAALTPFLIGAAIVLSGGLPKLMWIGFAMSFVALLLLARAIKRYRTETPT